MRQRPVSLVLATSCFMLRILEESACSRTDEGDFLGGEVGRHLVSCVPDVVKRKNEEDGEEEKIKRLQANPPAYDLS